MASKKVTVEVPLKGTNVKKGVNYAKERLLNAGDNRAVSALERRKRKAKRKSQLVGYSQLLKEL